MHLKLIQSCMLGLLVLVGLSACSGGGDDAQTAPPAALPAIPAEGLWIGTTSSNRTISQLVLDDGIYWALYSEVGAPSILAGLIQGNSSSLNGVFTSSNAKDFNLETGILNATINGSYVAKQSLNGTIVYQNSPQVTFTATYDSDYELIPDMNAVAGTYTGFVTATETVTVAVSSSGAITGNSDTGCTFSGSFSPRAHGNVFDVTVTFDGQPGCSIGTETVNGIGFYDAGSKQLYSAALNSTRTNGFVFIGTKP